MGCGCNQTKPTYAEPKTMVGKLRNTVKKVWEATQTVQQPQTHVVKRINKK
jgi:hypothetical protein|tara:strand:+ start:796 stop:948 length:153 start_codon:yes stop_codon:yes gene_type:complete